MSSTDEQSDRPHVVVVGAGFAGIACAKELGKHGVAVTLIDRNTYHQFQPLLYQVATAQLAPVDIMRPLRGLFRKTRSVDVKEAEIVGVDPVARTATTADGHTFAGTHLVLATGARANFFGVAGAEEHALPLYTATDALVLRNRIFELFEAADLDPARIDQGALDFVIVGGGPTGVEAAGALADLVHDVMPQRYHGLDVGRARIHLVDHGRVLLGPFSDRAHDYVAEVLTKRGVDLLLDHSVTEVGPEHVTFGDGSRMRTHCVIWAGGLKVPPLAGTEPFAIVRGGRITAGQDLSVDGFPGVYAVGDVASVADPEGSPYPQLGSVAVQAGKATATSILADVAGQRTPSFRYHDKGIMAMIGRRAAIAEVGTHRHELHGPIAFSAWLGVHAWLLSTTRARIEAFMDWAWDSFSKSRDETFVFTMPDTPRIEWADDPDDDDRDDDPDEDDTDEATDATAEPSGVRPPEPGGTT
jgi:NADH dehydrogenase